MLIWSVHSSISEKCETNGFETFIREECEEVLNVECRPIMVKKDPNRNCTEM